MTYVQYIPQSCRKEKNSVYQPYSNNIHQLYNSMGGGGSVGYGKI